MSTASYSASTIGLAESESYNRLGAKGDMSVRDYFSVRKKPFDKPSIDKLPQPDVDSLPAPPLPSDDEETLRRFDLDSKYGPCFGLYRLERWQRAEKLGLDPPRNVLRTILTNPNLPECLWISRV